MKTWDQYVQVYFSGFRGGGVSELAFGMGWRYIEPNEYKDWFVVAIPGIILGMGSANERRVYYVTLTFIGPARKQNGPFEWPCNTRLTFINRKNRSMHRNPPRIHSTFK